MKTSTHLGAGLLIGLLLAAGIHPAGAQGTAFSYQGHLQSNGSPATGSFDFRFRLASDAMGNIYVGGPILTNAVPVDSGLFTVALDFGGAFTGSNLWLQIEVKTNGAGGYTTLAPLQFLTPTPYAIMASTASNLLGTLPAAQLTGAVGTGQLADGAVTGPKILDGSVANADLANNAVNSVKIANGSIANADLADGAVDSAKILDGSIVGADLANGSVGSDQLADTIALGNPTNANGVLTIYRTGTSSPGVWLDGASGSIVTYGSDGLEQCRLWNGSWGELILHDLTDNHETVYLSAGSDSGGQLLLRSGTGVNRLFFYSDFSGTARIGIGRSPAVNQLEVAGNASKDVAGSWIANSDRRIKQDVRPLTNALELINRVRPVGFRYTEEYLAEHPAIRDHEYYNVIAQEFAQVFPDSVQAGGDHLANGEAVLQVDTYPATIYSIAAIQQLDREVKARDDRIAALEKNIAELRAIVGLIQ
jgi:hypothetical protein